MRPILANIARATAGPLVLGALWTLWALAATSPPDSAARITKEFAKDLALPFAVIAVAALIRTRATEMTQVRAALLPQVYGQIQHSWVPIAVRLRMFALEYARARHAAGVIDRRLHDILMARAELRRSFNEFGLIHFTSLAAEDVIAACEFFLEDWLTDMFGTKSVDVILEAIGDDRPNYFALNKRLAHLPAAQAARDKYVRDFSDRTPRMEALAGVAWIFYAVVNCEMNQLVRFWYREPTIIRPDELALGIEMIDRVLTKLPPSIGERATPIISAAKTYAHGYGA
jgi:hypothetical protein